MITKALTVVRGDATPLGFTLTDARTGGPLDLTGVAGIRFTAKTHVEDADVDAVIVHTVGAGVTVSATPTDGTLEVQLEPEGTATVGTLLWDLQVTDDAGPHTVMGGTLQITADISRTAP